jgi:hypothetical protein
LNEDIISEVFQQETERETHKRKIDVKLGTPDCERCLLKKVVTSVKRQE